MTYQEQKEAIQSQFNAIEEAYEDGELSAYDYYRLLKFNQVLVESVINGAEYEAKKRLESIYTKEELAQIGVDIREGRAMYDFKQITYAPYVAATKELAESKLKVKNLEDMLKANAKLNEKNAMVNTDTGECEILEMPIVTYSKPSVIIKQF